MKTKILLSILAFPVLVFGQVVNHFDHIDSKWNVVQISSGGFSKNPDFESARTTVYGFQGDTLIDNKLWFKLYSTQDSLFQKNLQFRGLTRTEEHRVLYLDTSYQLDTLYDFNLNVGDSVLFTFHEPYGDFSYKIPIIKIDSVEINGQYYKRFKFDEPDFPIIVYEEMDEVWIEGIGSKHGPLFPNISRTFSQEFTDYLLMICSYSNGQHLWRHPGYSSCYINIVQGLNNKAISELTFSPNPVKDLVHISMSKSDNYEICIFNVTGQKLMQKTINSDAETIDLKTLIDGIYFIVVDSKTERWSGKLIKKRNL